MTKQKWPDKISDEENAEFLKKIKIDFIEEASFRRNDPYYEHAADRWELKLVLSVNGGTIRAYTSDKKLIEKFGEELGKSDEFFCKTQVPFQFGHYSFVRRKKFTSEIAEKINVDDILYAEIASGGAFGRAGAGRLYTINGDYYYSDSQDDDSYLSRLLEQAKDSKNICYCYGGFGNDAFKNKAAFFKNDDEAHIFTYTDKRPLIPMLFIIRPSCRGVYEHVLANFAYEPITEKTIAQWLRHTKSFDKDETCLLHAIAEYYKRHSVETSLDDYMNSIVYIRFLNNMDSHYDWENWISDWRGSLAKYRLRYILDSIKVNRLNNVLARFDIKKAKPGDLLQALSEELNEDVSKLFTTYTVEKRKKFSIFKLHGLRYPVVINMPKAAHEETVAQILDTDPDQFTSAYSLGEYFASCIFCLDKLELATVLPAAFYVLRNMPMQTYSSIDVQATYWAASELVNTAWKIIGEPKTPARFEKEIYETFWEKIGGLWPIEHYGEFRFCLPDGEKNEAGDYIFKEALGYVTSLEEIEKINPELKNYLCNVTDDNCSDIIWNRAVDLQFGDASDELALEAMYSRLNEWAFAHYYPTSVKRAELLFKELLAGEDWRLEDYKYSQLWFALASGMQKLGVGKRLVELMVEHFDEIRDNLCDEDVRDLFCAFCTEPEVDMLPALTELKKKVSKIPCADQKVLDGALKSAANEIKKIAFQRESLRAEYCKAASVRKKVATKESVETQDEELSEDPFRAAAQLAIKHRRMSTAVIQRNLHVGYGRALAIKEQLEELGVLGPAIGGNKPQEVMIDDIKEYDEKIRSAGKDYE